MDNPVRERSWVRRNWRRIAVSVFSLAVIGSVIAIVSFNNSDAKRLAVASATSNEELVARIGQPMRFGSFIGGGIEETRGFGKAELAIPVSGPKGKGTLYVAALKEAGIWKLTFLQFGTDNNAERMQLLK